MATKKNTKKKVTKKTDAKSVVRKGTLAYLGLYGFAAERARLRADQVKELYTKATDGLLDDLIERGENVEKLALGTAQDAQKLATDAFETTTDKVKAIVPFGGNDRVEELEAEVAALNKKISALSKKASKPRKTVKTEKSPAKTAGINTQVTSPKVA